MLNTEGVDQVKRHPLTLFMISTLPNMVIGWDHLSNQSFVMSGVVTLELDEAITVLANEQDQEESGEEDDPVQPDPEIEDSPPSTEHSISDSQDDPPEPDTSTEP